jgi:hypothetical protein
MGTAGALLTRRRRTPLELDILIVLSVVQLAMHKVLAATADPGGQFGQAV